MLQRLVIEPGVLVDDDGRTYIYCDFKRSVLAEVNSDNMYEIIDGSCIEHFIPCAETEEGGFTDYTGWTYEYFNDRSLFELSEFVFMK